MRTIHRDAITGEIVTAKYAKKNPDTTVKETMKRVPKKAVDVLKRYQKWRDGGYIGPSPKEVEMAIDEILKYFDK